MKIVNNFGIIRVAKGMPYFELKRQERFITKAFWITAALLLCTVIIIGAIK